MKTPRIEVDPESSWTREGLIARIDGLEICRRQLSDERIVSGRDFVAAVPDLDAVLKKAAELEKLGYYLADLNPENGCLRMGNSSLHHYPEISASPEFGEYNPVLAVTARTSNLLLSSATVVSKGRSKRTEDLDTAFQTAAEWSGIKVEDMKKSLPDELKTILAQKIFTPKLVDLSYDERGRNSFGSIHFSILFDKVETRLVFVFNFSKKSGQIVFNNLELVTGVDFRLVVDRLRTMWSPDCNYTWDELAKDITDLFSITKEHLSAFLGHKEDPLKNLFKKVPDEISEDERFKQWERLQFDHDFDPNKAANQDLFDAAVDTLNSRPIAKRLWLVKTDDPGTGALAEVSIMGERRLPGHPTILDPDNLSWNLDLNNPIGVFEINAFTTRLRLFGVRD